MKRDKNNIEKFALSLTFKLAKKLLLWKTRFLFKVLLQNNNNIIPKETFSEYKK